MPQARSGGSGSGSSGGSSRRTTRTSRSKSTGGSSTSSRSKSTGRSTTARSTSGRKTSGRSTTKRSTSARSTAARGKSAAGSAEARVEAVAQRLRKLNERIIDAGKEAGETSLSNYEKVLKTIATSIEKGPGASDVEWISNLATAQAKFIRDVTTSWTSAARKVLK